MHISWWWCWWCCCRLSFQFSSCKLELCWVVLKFNRVFFCIENLFFFLLSINLIQLTFLFCVKERYTFEFKVFVEIKLDEYGIYRRLFAELVASLYTEVREKVHWIEKLITQCIDVMQGVIWIKMKLKVLNAVRKEKTIRRCYTLNAWIFAQSWLNWLKALDQSNTQSQKPN